MTHVDILRAQIAADAAHIRGLTKGADSLRAERDQLAAIVEFAIEHKLGRFRSKSTLTRKDRQMFDRLGVMLEDYEQGEDQ